MGPDMRKPARAQAMIVDNCGLDTSIVDLLLSFVHLHYLDVEVHNSAFLRLE